MAERVGERTAKRFLCGGERDGGGKAARDLGGKARPRQHRDLRPRRHLLDDLRDQLAARLLDALRADHQRLLFLQIWRELARDRTHMLGRGRHEQEVAIGDLVETRGRLYRGVEFDAGEIDLVAMLALDIGERFGLMRPDQHIAAGTTGGDGERGAPCACPHDADRLKRHAETSSLFICQILLGGRNRPLRPSPRRPMPAVHRGRAASARGQGPQDRRQGHG